MLKRIAATVCLGALLLTPACVGEQSYGTGHENHQYACWDNGDGTHTVACDCGVEKRIEAHGDADANGICEGCGTIMEPVDSEAAPAPDDWKIFWNAEGGVMFGIPSDAYEWVISNEEARGGIVFRASNEHITVQLRAYGLNEITYETFIEKLTENEYEVTGVRRVRETLVTEYMNPVAEADVELRGAVLYGADGRLYRISLFSGDDDDFSDDAAVWEIAGKVMETVRVRGPGGWNIYRRRVH